MKKTKILVPAMAMLALGTAASVTGTVAWFSVNNTVNVSGMLVKTKVQSNMLVADDTIGSTAKLADNLFSGDPLVQPVKGILEPVSTADAVNFYYTTDAKADGSTKADGTEIAYAFTQYNASAAATGDDAASYANKFSQDYGLKTTDAGNLITGQTGAVAYVEYVFQLKVNNTTADDQDIQLTELNIEYTQADEEADGERAFRVAIFCQDVTTGSVSAPAAGDRKGIWKESEAADFGGKVVNSTTTVTNSSYVSAATPIATVAGGATKYFKVVTRLWLEGQDTTCKNDTFAALAGSWTLTMELELDGETPVTALTKSVAE